MARHRLHIRAPQLGGGNHGGQATSTSSNLASIINSPSTFSADPNASIVTAAAPTTYTVITETFAIPTTAADGSVSVHTTLSAVPVTDPASYASITSAAAQSLAQTSQTSSSRTTSATSAATSASQKASSSNLGTLIPAIVVPIVVVLLATFALFWFYMRRRHRKELQSQPDIAMAGKGEKLSSRTNSSRSTNAPQAFKAPYEKSSTLAAVSEASSTRAPHIAPPKYSMEDIGVARPLTPKDSQVPGSRSPPKQFGAFPREQRPYQNFSDLRPSTARVPPQPRNGEFQSRNRSNSSPGKRGPPPGVDSRDLYRPGPGPFPRKAPSPVPRSGPSPVTFTRTSPSFDLPRSQPTNPRDGNAAQLRDPSPTMNHNARAGPPARLAAPPPGAFNGSSPISQYSPIVKDMPNIATAVPSTSKRGLPPPLQTENLNETRSQSPFSAGGNGLTEENMRIARLANSSRLGFNGESSPKLPPPATRSQLIPDSSPRDEYGGYFGKLEPNNNGDAERLSVISAPDDYEDIDAKSDVSSLNELEHFDFESKAGSRTASGVHDYFAGTQAGGDGRGSPFGALTPGGRF